MPGVREEFYTHASVLYFNVHRGWFLDLPKRIFMGMTHLTAVSKVLASAPWYFLAIQSFALSTFISDRR